jgi:hypothetical protein
MKNLIGNPFKVFLKEADKTIEGLLIELDDKYDYLQKDNSICIIPKQNVLYYETNQLSTTSKLINPSIVPDEKNITVFIDKVAMAELKVPTNIGANELVGFLYSNQVIQDALKGKKQKSLECFDDAVYIFTDQYQEKVSTDSVAFSMEANNPATTYLSSTDMVARLNRGIRGKNG